MVILPWPHLPNNSIITPAHYVVYFVKYIGTEKASNPGQKKRSPGSPHHLTSSPNKICTHRRSEALIPKQVLEGASSSLGTGECSRVGFLWMGVPRVAPELRKESASVRDPTDFLFVQHTQTSFKCFPNTATLWLNWIMLSNEDFVYLIYVIHSTF